MRRATTLASLDLNLIQEYTMSVFDPAMVVDATPHILKAGPTEAAGETEGKTGT